MKNFPGGKETTLTDVIFRSDKFFAGVLIPKSAFWKKSADNKKAWKISQGGKETTLTDDIFRSDQFLLAF